MTTIVSVNQTNILLDPGLMVAPRRFQLPPSARELRMLDLLRKNIINLSKNVDVISISHYHYDHYFPIFEQGTEELYRNKIIYTKDRRSKCNFEQRKKGKKFELYAKQIAKELKFCDGKELEHNDIKFRYSNPVWHGENGSLDGYVLLLTLRYKKDSLMFCPDVMGPISRDTTELIIKENPKTLILDGPMTEKSSMGYSHVLFKKAEQNLIEIMMNTKTKTIIMDHSTVRSLDYKKELKGILKIAKETDKEIVTAAEYANRPINQLEAKRQEMWSKEGY